jgi:hypothetical protein
MEDLFLSFGRGVIKFLVSLFVGTGVGMLTFGILTRDRPEVWSSREPPAELFLGIGAGLLSAAAMMIVLFFVVRQRGSRLPSGRPDGKYPDQGSPPPIGEGTFRK